MLLDVEYEIFLQMRREKFSELALVEKNSRHLVCYLVFVAQAPDVNNISFCYKIIPCTVIIILKGMILL